MTENKRYVLEYARGKPNFWDNSVDLADCYVTCEEVCDRLNEQDKTIQQLTHDATVLIQSNKDYRKENEKLKEENRQFKLLLQDMGLLMSDEEILDIRNEISDKLIKPLLKGNDFDVDVDTSNGFKIIPKGSDVE